MYSISDTDNPANLTKISVIHPPANLPLEAAEYDYQRDSKWAIV